MSYVYVPTDDYRDANLEGSSMMLNAKYEKKYKKLKRYVKNMVFENAAICDQVAQLQEKLLIVHEERRYLLKKIYHLQAVADMENQLQSQQLTRPASITSTHAPSSSQESPSVSKKNAAKRKSSEIPDMAKLNPKVKKTVTTKMKKIVQPIPLDITGRPVFPIVLGGLTVHSLGEVVSDRSGYHTEEFIYPVGFCSTRVYGSLKDPERKCVYTCKILDGGSSPRFEIVADSDLDAPLVGHSASQCHLLLLRHINRALGVDVVNMKGRGPEFFGFSHPTIQNLIQSSPGTRKCSSYKWIKFEVSRTGETPQGAAENEASLSFEALQRSIGFARSQRLLSSPSSSYGKESVSGCGSSAMKEEDPDMEEEDVEEDGEYDGDMGDENVMTSGLTGLHRQKLMLTSNSPGATLRDLLMS
ncbi:transforming growth factor beta regulator 1 [Ischnura elegans]|uniref:transforming growth factor beta regulator 1 n=1 Tax=Ischnura elegans TaxID=197161 RepID=UPI001ED868FF|nr:transforming growth factor beta regulator 1 [Ischnura elegans]